MYINLKPDTCKKNIQDATSKPSDFLRSRNKSVIKIVNINKAIKI